MTFSQLLIHARWRKSGQCMHSSNGVSNNPGVFRDCFRKCVEMSDLSERYVFQLVGTTLVIMPMTIQIPLVPDLEPLCEEVIDHRGCPIQGIVLLGGFVANVISLSVYPLFGDQTYEQVSPTYGLLGGR